LFTYSQGRMNETKTRRLRQYVLKTSLVFRLQNLRQVLWHFYSLGSARTSDSCFMSCHAGALISSPKKSSLWSHLLSGPTPTTRVSSLLGIAFLASFLALSLLSPLSRGTHNLASPLRFDRKLEDYYDWPTIQGRIRIKGCSFLRYSPAPKPAILTTESLHPVSTMLFHKSLVSLIMAFAAASSAAALIAPVARGNSGGPISPSTPIDQCNTGPLQCCESFTSVYDAGLSSDVVHKILEILDGTNAVYDVGRNCNDLVGGSVW
jgi:hypothetical protein